MGQKVHPLSFRLGYIRNWSSLWYSDRKNFGRLLHEDLKIRKHILKNFAQAAISHVKLERMTEKVRVNIHTARPGVIIGRKGSDIDRLKAELQEMLKGKEVQINIHEIKNPSLEAQLVAENIALQLEKRVAFRRAMKKAIQQTMDAGAKGMKVACKGRLGGAEIARKEGYQVGKVPLHTLRADIDYGFAESLTTYGKIGVKVWIYKGDLIGKEQVNKAKYFSQNVVTKE